MYVGEGYLAEDLFKLNVMVTGAINKNMNSSTYIVDYIDLWHSRLGHINYKSLHRMFNLNLLPKFDINMQKNVKYV